MSMEDLSSVLWRERDLLEMLAYKLEVEQRVLARGRTHWLAAAAREVEERLASGLAENQARWAAERMALVLQASLLVRHAPPAVADTFCATRLAGDWGHSYGTLPAGADIEGIVARQLVS